MQKLLSLVKSDFIINWIYKDKFDTLTIYILHAVVDILQMKRNNNIQKEKILQEAGLKFGIILLKM
jgi:hypothetical protein